MSMPKRKTRVSPTKFVLAICKKRGIPCRVVEKWVKTAKGGFRKDTWGADLQMLLSDSIIGVQAGIGSDHAEKVRHAISHPEVKMWLQSTSRKFHVWTFSQRVHFLKSGRKGKLPKWTPRVTEIYLENGAMRHRPFNLS